VIEVNSIDALRALGNKVSGKIVFFNRPADQRYVNTFRSYSSAVDQRVSGPAEAALLEAAGVVVRSVTTAYDTVPHTGITRYEKEGKNIPAVAISTKDADILSDLLKKDPGLRFSFRTTCGWNPDAPSHNVIGEFRGSEFPDEFITIGGHLDSWDFGEGAHDDGAGCIQSIEVLRLFKALSIVPRHTIRVVMFMDEEISQSGSKAYA
jgi:Zn-dependent M28 family amino/carboxypeptidase